jgi:hypothetical protein
MIPCIIYDQDRRCQATPSANNIRAMNLTAKLPLLACLLLVSCSSGFNRAWKQTTAQPAPARSSAGAWEGHWLSHSNGHTGKLRAIVGPLAGGARLVQYHATWGRILSGAFHTTHQTHGQEGNTTFIAREPIGRHGEFKAEGMITTDTFKANYTALGDHGIFELRRP